jgi:hypothetical protein
MIQDPILSLPDCMTLINEEATCRDMCESGTGPVLRMSQMRFTRCCDSIEKTKERGAALGYGVQKRGGRTTLAFEANIVRRDVRRKM